MIKLLIWGIGLATPECVNELIISGLGKDSIIGYIDSFSKKREYAGKTVYSPMELGGVPYDAIVVATKNAKGVRETCNQYGIDLSKVIFYGGNITVTDYNSDYTFVESCLGKRLADTIKNRYHVVPNIYISINDEERQIKLENWNLHHNIHYKYDYVRVKNFELIANEIIKNQIEGNIAELGVFRGEFAQFLNIAFADRKLYLFDTFEGFNEYELNRDVEDGVIRSSFSDTFLDSTSIDMVLDKMRYPDNVSMVKGYFPESLRGLEDVFAFVSIDCDWEESIYQGLAYFYPRLTNGGYIMVHDYNNYIACAGNAIKRYEENANIKLAKVPICDAHGSIIIMKG